MNNKCVCSILVAVLCSISTSINADNWLVNTASGIMSAYPTSLKVGIGIVAPQERLHIDNGVLKIGNGTSAVDRSKNLLRFGDEDYVQIGEWEADDLLSFYAERFNFSNGNVGIGVINPLCALDVNGKVYLRTYNWADAYAHSYLQWQCHKLVMGVPKGEYSVAMVDITPGGCSQDSLYSQLKLYTAYDENTHVAKIKLNTMENCWINTPGFVGIGTELPQCKLDVRGALRADEIYVNIVSGADYVFDDTYNLRPLSEVQTYIMQNKHLPEIPSAEDMQEHGINMNEFQIQLLQKIEELTLYVIQQEQRIKELESQLAK